MFHGKLVSGDTYSMGVAASRNQQCHCLSTSALCLFGWVTACDNLFFLALLCEEIVLNDGVIMVRRYDVQHQHCYLSLCQQAVPANHSGWRWLISVSSIKPWIGCFLQQIHKKNIMMSDENHI